MLEPLEAEIRSLHAMIGSERDPDGRAFAPLADAYRRAGEPRKAMGLLTEGLARRPDFASGHVVAARLYAEIGLYEEGELAARKVLDLDPENVSGMVSLVRVLVATGRVDEGAEVFSMLETLEPEFVEEEGLTRPEPMLAASDLAPAEEEEAVLDVGALAPEEEPVLAVSDLAPAEEEEAVLDVGALAPEEEPVLAVSDLAPAEEEEAVLDVGALAPEEEPVLAVSDLAPAEEEEAVLDVGALAPEEEPVLAVSDLAPAEEEEAVLDVGALAPEEEPVLAVSDLAPDEAAPTPKAQGTPRILTRTLGDLYAKQGFLDRAVDVYRQLLADAPEDESLSERLRELEARLDGLDGSVGADPEGSVEERGSNGARNRARDEELEALARDLVGNRESDPEIDTPFAWGDSEEASDEHEDGPSIGGYFDGLLDWQPGQGRS